MISVILYGRNDAHGYNLHRRAALSLNCIAEVLTDPDDEIVFVDYNTPDELPTFVEALADTLTERCLGLLRVLRVPAAIHEERFAARTHLPALEPVARNAAVRRANPSNRWLLSTNTDMIFVPLVGPEPERDLRRPPGRVLRAAALRASRVALGAAPAERSGRGAGRDRAARPGLRLDEPTLSHEWIRFDAPGDFQLVLREDFVAIDGFDEEMLLGWHVDSNFSRRMLLHRGSIESLEGRARRLPLQPQPHADRLPRREDGLERPRAVLRLGRARRASRAARDLGPRRRRARGGAGRASASGGRFAAAVLAAAPTARRPRVRRTRPACSYELTYDSGHVLPFVADSLAVAPPGATVGYVGANTVLEQSLAALVARARRRPLAGGRRPRRLRARSTSWRAPRTCSSSTSASTCRLPTLPRRRRRRLPARAAPGEARSGLPRARATRGARARPRRARRASAPLRARAQLDRVLGRVRPGAFRLQPHDGPLTRSARDRQAGPDRRRGDAGVARCRSAGSSAGRRAASWGGRASRCSAHDAVELADLRTTAASARAGPFRTKPGSGRRARAPRSRSRSTGSRRAAIRPRALARQHLRRAGRDAQRSRRSRTASRSRPGRSATATRTGTSSCLAAAPNGAVDLTFEIEEPGSPLALGWSAEDERPLGILLRTVTLLPAADPAARAGLARERRLGALGGARADEGERRLHIRPGETVELTELSDYGGLRRRLGV